MMSEDLYGILEINKSASDAEIKKAYRGKARKFHPDVNKDAGAEAKFKEIQKAYYILSDAKRRQQYDQFGIADDSAGGQGGAGQGFDGFGDQFEDIFDAFFGGGGRRSGQGGPRKGEDLRFDLDLTLEEVATDQKKEIEIFHLDRCGDCKGSGSQSGSASVNCSHCQGSGQVRTVQRTMLGSFSQVIACHHCGATGRVIKNPCKSCHGKGLEKRKKKINVDIPAGVDTGVKLRVNGKGNHGESGGAPGDLYVVLHVSGHKYLQREGDDIILEIEVPYTKVILGTQIEVPILNGKAKLIIPEGTQPDTVFRLKGKGIPHLQGYGKGDQFVRVKVKMPKKLSGKEKKLVEELMSLQGEKASAKGTYQYVRNL